MESLNPGGTGKDRAAKYMISHALQALHDDSAFKGDCQIYEGTSGSTGINLTESSNEFT